MIKKKAGERKRKIVIVLGPLSWAHLQRLAQPDCQPGRVTPWKAGTIIGCMVTQGLREWATYPPTPLPSGWISHFS
jgi:hypothetical protein